MTHNNLDTVKHVFTFWIVIMVIVAWHNANGDFFVCCQCKEMYATRSRSCRGRKLLEQAEEVDLGR